MNPFVGLKCRLIAPRCCGGLRDGIDICTGNYKDLSIGEISKQLGERWKGMSDEDKQPYEVCTPTCWARKTSA